MIKDTYGRRVTLRLPDDLAEEIEEHISISGVSFTEFLRRALREKLDREKRAASGRPEPLTMDDVIKMLDDTLPAYIEKHLTGEKK